jgi:hypothetical protein
MKAAVMKKLRNREVEKHENMRNLKLRNLGPEKPRD